MLNKVLFVLILLACVNANAKKDTIADDIQKLCIDAGFLPPVSITNYSIVVEHQLKMILEFYPAWRDLESLETTRKICVVAFGNKKIIGRNRHMWSENLIPSLEEAKYGVTYLDRNHLYDRRSHDRQLMDDEQNLENLKQELAANEALNEN